MKAAKDSSSRELFVNLKTLIFGECQDFARVHEYLQEIEKRLCEMKTDAEKAESRTASSVVPMLLEKQHINERPFLSLVRNVSEIVDALQSGGDEQDTPRHESLSVAIKSTVWVRDGGRCTQTDEVTNKRCRARSNLHVDPIVPCLNGGSSQDVHNLRVLCTKHRHERVIKRCRKRS